MKGDLSKESNGDNKTPPKIPNGKYPPDPVSLFCSSPATIAVLLLRTVCLIPREWLPLTAKSSASSTLGWILHSVDLAPIWTSTLIRPFETWDHVREARAIRQLFGAEFRNVYRGSYVHLPPLVLAAFEPLSDLPEYAIGIATHLVDLLIAIKLLQLGKLVLQELRDPWEDALQPRVPESLRPPLAHVFALDDTQLVYTDELPPQQPPPPSEEGNDSSEVKKQSDDAAEKKTETNNQQTGVSSEDPEEQDKTPDFIPSDLPLLAAQVYFYSPITALASGIGSTHHSFQNLWLLLLLQSLHEGCGSVSSVPLSAFWLALATYMECHHCAFLIPLAIFLWRRPAANGASKVKSLILFYLLWSICLQGLSLLLVGSTQYTAMLQSSFGHVFLWKHLHPNFSVLWYLNMELFERYRVYFSILIGGLPYLLLAPITIRLYRYPMELVTITWMLWTMIRPTTTLVDVNVACCLALLCPRSLARMRTGTTLVPAFSIPVPITLYIITLWMWLETGQGEANFTFFQCLGYCAFLSTLCLEFCGATMRRDKVLRFTEKLLSQKQRDEAKERQKDASEGAAKNDGETVTA